MNLLCLYDQNSLMLEFGLLCWVLFWEHVLAN
ncbi:LOW QUALITY PROTEIN: hypothetical protein PanWU01x14_073660 [Parasponia andersonii]|uniref:Uncharacterized protein n=1 Tax=Parasponia andersonii TaxID=3476 RepID=A0A2P5DE65_PARAD|nr:LOW QUALITY PROTEIN: hypothetical protein PanWU01x14_073660 [Parasponia andersonii]